MDSGEDSGEKPMRKEDFKKYDWRYMRKDDVVEPKRPANYDELYKKNQNKDSKKEEKLECKKPVEEEYNFDFTINPDEEYVPRKEKPKRTDSDDDW